MYYNNLKLFIDRSDSKYSHCKIINNDDLIKFLKKEKFEIIKPENISLNEQIKKFNSAKTIIGAHGAGLTNIVFSKKADLFYKVRRLIDEKQMGELFKVMLIKNKKNNFRTGFSNWLNQKNFQTLKLLSMDFLIKLAVNQKKFIKV